jgi:uncharacterized protein (TIGR00730 family)
MYLEAAVRLGRTLAERGHGVVYGGASVGLMGALADAALAAGGEVVGVIPRSMIDRELAHHGLTALHVVDTMHERKARMTDLADAFVAIPGGHGTLDELFEALTWSQLGIHAKPIGLWNLEGYYDALLAFLDHASAQGFVRPHDRARLRAERELDTLLPALLP